MKIGCKKNSSQTKSPSKSKEQEPLICISFTKAAVAINLIHSQLVLLPATQNIPQILYSIHTATEQNIFLHHYLPPYLR